MAEENNKYVIPSAEVIYPRIDQTYKFDTTANQSVPCGALDDGAEYSLSFKLPKAEAVKLFKAMKAYYDVKKEKGWPDKFPNPFKEQEDGLWLGKAKLKGAFGKDASRKPLQVDSRNTPLGDDFKLTSGSVANIQVSFVPYNISGNGVSLRLGAVQVLKYVPLQTRSPFEAVDDGFVAGEASPFESVDSGSFDTPDPFEETVEEPVEEPKKKAVKKSAPAPKKDSDDLSSLIDEWDD